MRLHEEYLRRKDIRIPLVLFEGDSGVLLRSRNSPHHWMALTFRWIHNEHWHPGSFWFNKYEFPHDGASRRQRIAYSDRGKQLYWDEYEDEVIGLVSYLKRDYIVVTEEEFNVAACQILLNSCDSLIAERLSVGKLNSNFCKDVALVLDSNRDIGERVKATNAVLAALRSVMSLTDDVIHEIRNYLKQSGWLASLFKDENILSDSGQESHI